MTHKSPLKKWFKFIGLVLAAAFVTVATTLLPACGKLIGQESTPIVIESIPKTASLYIAPEAAGSGDGSSWANAAGLEELPTLLETAAAGDEIWLRGDLGAYDVGDMNLSIKYGGTADAPITIRGVAEDGSTSATPLLVGNRAEDWQPDRADGREVFRLLSGANHLVFSNLEFENVGNGAFRIGADIEDLTIENVKAHNVRRLIENTKSGDAETATISGLTVRNVDIRGFSKGAIRLRYDTHDVLLEDIYGDSEAQDGDNFAMGIYLGGTVHDVVHRRVTMLNCIQTKSDSDYWNADGFVTERDTYDITYEDTYAAGNTDGGYDLKSNNTVLINTRAADNKRNYRFWGSAELRSIVSDEPVKRGGSGSTTHLWAGKGATVTLIDPEFTGDQDIENLIFEVEDDSQVTVKGGSISDNRYILDRQEEAATLTLENLQQKTQPTARS